MQNWLPEVFSKECIVSFLWHLVLRKQWGLREKLKIWVLAAPAAWVSVSHTLGISFLIVQYHLWYLYEQLQLSLPGKSHPRLSMATQKGQLGVLRKHITCSCFPYGGIKKFKKLSIFRNESQKEWNAHMQNAEGITERAVGFERACSDHSTQKTEGTLTAKSKLFTVCPAFQFMGLHNILLQVYFIFLCLTF